MWLYQTNKSSSDCIKQKESNKKRHLGAKSHNTEPRSSEVTGEVPPSKSGYFNRTVKTSNGPGRTGPCPTLPSITCKFSENVVFLFMLKTRPIYEFRCDERLKSKAEESTHLTWEIKSIKPTYECRCNGRLQTKRFTRLTHTGSVVELEQKLAFIMNRWSES